MGIVTASILAAAAIGGAIYQSETQKKIATKGRRLQEKAMDEAKVAAVGEQRDAMAERARLNRKKPNADELLASEQMATSRGVGGTMLTGPGGANPGGSYSSTSLLGG